MSDQTATDLDYSVRYSVDGYSGIAFWIEPNMIPEYWSDGEPTGELVQCESFVLATMVGDDRKHVIDIADLTPLDDLDYCAECGSLGCTTDGRDRGIS